MTSFNVMQFWASPTTYLIIPTALAGIEFEQLQRTMSNKVVTASDKYSIGSPSIRYIIYGCVLMLFHVQVSLIALLTTFTGVFDQETPQTGPIKLGCYILWIAYIKLISEKIDGHYHYGGNIG